MKIVDGKRLKFLALGWNTSLPWLSMKQVLYVFEKAKALANSSDHI